MYALYVFQFIALGPSTKRRVTQAGLTVAGTAINPTVSSLISTIKKIKNPGAE